jgi:hypothetical protein
MVALSHELDELNQKIVLDTAAFLATNIAIQAPQGRSWRCFRNPRFWRRMVPRFLKKRWLGSRASMRIGAWIFFLVSILNSGLPALQRQTIFLILGWSVFKTFSSHERLSSIYCYLFYYPPNYARRLSPSLSLKLSRELPEQMLYETSYKRIQGLLNKKIQTPL